MSRFTHYALQALSVAASLSAFSGFIPGPYGAAVGAASTLASALLGIFNHNKGAAPAPKIEVSK